MLIRVVPSGPHGSVLYNIHLGDPKHQEHQTWPAAYTMQMDNLEALQEDGLGVESPADIHAYDKAAWQTALFTEVVFDLKSRCINCTLVDGSTASWRISSRAGNTGCIPKLEQVILDVYDPNRERYTDDDESSSTDHAGPSSPSTSVPPVSSGSNRSHKRQRSFFSSLVAVFKGAMTDNSGRGAVLPTSLPPLKIPSGSSYSHCRSSSTFSRTQRSPPMSPTVPDSPMPPPVFQLQIRPRQPIDPPPKSRPLTPSEVFKNRARSALVDAVRRYVYPMFSTVGSPSFAEVENAPEVIAQTYGFPPGLYPAWALRSLLRKTDERIREMMTEANEQGYGQLLDHVRRHQGASTTSREADDEDDATTASTSASATSVSTETDGSSVHTPTDSPVRSPFAPAPRLSPIETKLVPQVPRSPSPPSPMFEFDMATYHALGKLRSRINSLLSRMDSSPRQPISDNKYSSDLTILEIKSRRRAWSAKDYVGGARLAYLGFATPFRSSPLARCEPVTPESLARMQAQTAREPERPSLFATRPLPGLSEVSAEFGVSVGVKAVTKEMDARLFPVCEEDEEEEGAEYHFEEYVEEDDDGWRDMHEFDLESGLLAFPRPEPVQTSNANVYTQMHPMVRTRTQSMRTERARLPVLAHQQKHGESGLSPESLLCQPLNAMKIQVPVILDGDDAFGLGEGRGGEFTLSMDLPPPPRGWDVSRG